MIAKYELLLASLLIAITLLGVGPMFSFAPPPSQTTADFLLTVTPTIVQTIIAGETISYVLSVTSLGGFNSAVNLQLIGALPPNAHAEIVPSSVTPVPGQAANATLTIATTAATPAGAYNIAITGSSTLPPISRTVIVTLEVAASTDDFTLSVSPSVLTIAQGGSGTAIFTVTTIGFANVSGSLAALGAPTGVSVSFSPNPVTAGPGATATSTVSISVNQNVPVGNYTITILGVWNAPAGSVVHTADLLLSVSLPRCLIATATYGSELSPEVQVLRNFRDHQILSTASGMAFMVAFNAWYYSFSPYVAGYLSTHSVERTVMKGVLYPLIGILGLSSLAFSTSSAFPEFAAFLSGLVASSLIGAFYVGLPLSLLRAKVRRLRGSGTKGMFDKLLAVTLLAGLLMLLVGEILAFSALLMIASVAIVLSMVLLSAAYTSRWITGKLQAQ